MNRRGRPRLPLRPVKVGEVLFDRAREAAGRVAEVTADRVTLVRPGRQPWTAERARTRPATEAEVRQLAAVAAHTAAGAGDGRPVQRRSSGTANAPASRRRNSRMPERPDPEAGEVWFDQRKGQAGRVLAVRPGAEQVTLVRPGGHPWFAAFAQLRRPTAHEERQLAALARLHRQAVRDR